MPQTITSPSESLPPMPLSDATPAKPQRISELVAAWEADGERRQALAAARQWIADEFYQEETLRTLRLRKGWSQTQLAKEIGTSQSHVARIERGTENLTLQTCRRLCTALEIDLNTLDAALRRAPAPPADAAA